MTASTTGATTTTLAAFGVAATDSLGKLHKNSPAELAQAEVAWLMRAMLRFVAGAYASGSFLLLFGFIMQVDLHELLAIGGSLVYSLWMVWRYETLDLPFHGTVSVCLFKVLNTSMVLKVRVSLAERINVAQH